MKIKFFLSAFLILACAVAVHAQKVVDRSAPKRPVWVGNIENGYIITSAVAPTLEEAKRKCMDQVKVEMLASVAQNVEYSTETLLTQITHNQDVDSDINFVQKGKTSVASLPYLTGVSEINAREAYWEKTYNKKSGVTEYTYSLIYPFSSSDFDSLKTQFDSQEAEMEAKVSASESRLESFGSVDELQEALSNLKLAEGYYFDAKRKAEVSKLIDRCRDCFAQLSVVSNKTDRCRYKCYITHNGRIIRYSALPKCKSETATDIRSAVDSDGGFVILFSDEDCVPDDENRINVSFPIGQRTLRHTINF